MRRADLRHPIESLERTGDRWSQWSSVPMIEMSALETYRFLRARIPPPTSASAGSRLREWVCDA